MSTTSEWTIAAVFLLFLLLLFYVCVYSYMYIVLKKEAN